jgi:hypothetical protein
LGHQFRRQVVVKIFYTAHKRGSTAAINFSGPC